MADDISQIPFIDIAVQDAVREAMLDGKAAIIFDRDVQDVIWANGAAANLFGYDAIGDFLTAGLAPFAATMRQLEAAAARGPKQPQAMLLRVSAGMGSGLAQAHIQIAKLPNIAAEVVLLIIERGDNETDDRLLAADAIAGLEADGAGAAITGSDGKIIAGGALFEALDFPASEIAALTSEIVGEDDRLVKRLVSRGEGHTYLAAGIGRLSENPVRNLIVAMETDEQEVSAPTPVAVAPIKLPKKPYSQTIPEAPPLVDLNDADEEEFEDGLFDDEADLPHKPYLSQTPVRFVWKTDVDGTFIDISPEFASAVGRNAADIMGRSMQDIVRLFDLDPSGEIETSMTRRDTWSGKTVLWPVQGTDLRVPVDLAALPYYNRERIFEGYRGFGIVRMADAVIDPEEIGHSLNDGQILEKEAAQPEPDEDDVSDDPFDGEVPALDTSNITPLRREADRDKIIPLDAERRDRAKTDELEENEAAAFRRIGVALSKDAEIANDDAAPPVSSPYAEPEPEVSDDWLARLDEEDALSRAEEAAANNTDMAETVDGVDVPLGLGPDELDALPLPLLIVRGETALYGNTSFAAMSGYHTISALNNIGLSALFGDEDTELEGTASQDNRALTVMRADGQPVTARTHLQLVPWLGSKAMMFAFDPQTAVANDDLPNAAIDDDSMMAVSDSLKSAAFDEVAEMRAILDTATDGVVVISQDGSIRSINSSAAALFGYRADDVVGKSFSILFAHESQRAAMDYLNGFSNNGVSSLLNEGREVLAREQNGGFLPVFITIGKLPTSNGYCAVMRDITPWKQTEQALQTAKDQAEEASGVKSEFLAKVSHEIRTPLNAIIGFSELMGDERFGPIGNERYKEYLIDINKSGRHVLDLVNDLLDISKIEAGEQELDFEGVVLNEAVADAVSMVQPQANRNRIIVRSSLESNLPSVVADARSIKQIVINLLSNAIRFTHSGGQVVVTTNYTAHGTVILRIRDTGIGMSSQEIETALRPFQQVTTRERGDGTGLGLPLTKALVEANRAEFEIASEPGRGTSVEITFPSARVLAD